MFENVGKQFEHCSNHVDRKFRSLFGCSSKHCSQLWYLLRDNLPTGSEPKHLLCALLFLKVYGTEHVVQFLV